MSIDRATLNRLTKLSNDLASELAALDKQLSGAVTLTVSKPACSAKPACKAPVKKAAKPAAKKAVAAPVKKPVKK